MGGPVPRSFELAFADLYRLAYRVAYRHPRDRAEAEDIAQEALARATLRWASLHYRPEGWISRVASNLAVDRYRRRRREPVIATGPDRHRRRPHGRAGRSGGRAPASPPPPARGGGLALSGGPVRGRRAATLGARSARSRPTGPAGLSAMRRQLGSADHEWGRCSSILTIPRGWHPVTANCHRSSIAARRIQVRRRWALAVMTCSVLVAASVGFSRPAFGPPAPSIASDYQFNLVKSPYRSGSPVPETALVDVQFAHAQYGFALAVHRDEVLLAASSDGGSSWQVRNSHLPVGLGPADDYPGQMEFVGFTGYLWGARTATGAPLWVTHDEGASWQQASIGPYVLDVSVYRPRRLGPDGDVPDHPIWRVMRGGLTSPWMAGRNGRWSDRSRSSTRVPEASSADLFELARITKDRAYVLSSLAEQTSSPAGLSNSPVDGGTTAGRRSPHRARGSTPQGLEIRPAEAAAEASLAGRLLVPDRSATQHHRPATGQSGGHRVDGGGPARRSQGHGSRWGYMSPLAPVHRNLPSPARLRRGCTRPEPACSRRQTVALAGSRPPNWRTQASQVPGRAT